jgi:hypothetical protein
LLADVARTLVICRKRTGVGVRAIRGTKAPGPGSESATTTGAHASAKPPAVKGTESVVESWYHSKERSKGLGDAEKRVAAIALVLLVGAFIFIKLTAKRATDAVHESDAAAAAAGAAKESPADVVKVSPPADNLDTFIEELLTEEKRNETPHSELPPRVYSGSRWSEGGTGLASA